MVIDQLPDVVLFELFLLLSCEEKIRLKGVCRRLNSLLTEHLIEAPRCLFVHRYVISLSENWGSPDQRIQRTELVHVNLFFRCLAVGYLQNLKSLYLFDLEPISSYMYMCIKPEPQVLHLYQHPLLLRCLAHLDELFTSWEIESYDSPNLKSISIQYVFKPVHIHSQRLERLVFWNVAENSIALSNPEMIRHIECVHFKEKSFQIDSFPNLESLNCQSISANFQLSKYPKLKKLGVCPIRSRCTPDSENSKLEMEFQILHRLIREKQALQRSDLEITVSGFKEISSIAFKGFGIAYDLKREELRQLREHFSSFVSPLPGHTKIFLSPAVDLQGLSTFTRLLSILVVEIHEDPNPELVITFLREINGVRTLRLKNCSYGPEFYDQLSSVPFISRFVLNKCEMSAVTSYHFLFAIRFLREFSAIDIDLPLEELRDTIVHLLWRSEIKNFSLYYNQLCNEQLVFEVSQRAGLPNHEIDFKHFLIRKKFRLWQEAVAFFRECEQTIREYDLGSDSTMSVGLLPYLEFEKREPEKLLKKIKALLKKKV